MSQFDFDTGPGEVYGMDKWDGYPAARVMRPIEPVLGRVPPSSRFRN